MPQVPTTQTIVDTHKELYNLRLEISALKSEKESVSKTIQLAFSELSDIQNRTKDSKTLANNFIELYQEFLDDVRLSKENGYNLIRETRDIVELQLKELSRLNSEIDKSNTLLQEATDKCNEEHQKIVKENEQLNVIRKDLDIYRDRVQCAINKNNLNIKIL